jgi:excinuclease ABC subunit C
VSRVRAYFDSGGESLLRQFSAERETASANLAFEDAAAIHARLEKLKPVVSQLPEIVQRLDRLSALMIQTSHVAGSVALFQIEQGCVSGPVPFPIQPSEHAKSQSMEARVHEALRSHPPAVVKSATEIMEHIALLKRWFYRSSRAGEIFFASKGELPLRRIVRGISRVFRGEKPEAERVASPSE